VGADMNETGRRHADDADSPKIRRRAVKLGSRLLSGLRSG
jgi:hypothetical protein